MNSSTSTPACFKTPESVPVLTSRCRGTTQKWSARRSITWLPFWRTTTNPSFSIARTASAPDTCGILGGTCRDVESRQHRVANGLRRNLLEIEFCRLPQVRQRILYGLALGRRTGFGVEGRSEER